MSLRVQRLSKSYGERLVLREISFECARGEFFSILGKSGSGKTTLLRLVAGLERSDDGKIFLNEKDVTALAAHQRKIPIVFQNYALFPHLNVFENVAFGLREQKRKESDIRATVLETLKLLSIDDKMYRLPAELSGGEQQRVAIARALAVQAPITLFDEPLSNLDLDLRRAMQKELKFIQRQMGRTFIYVTHDQEEALTLSDKLLILHKGRACECGSPEDIYHRPKTLFGARFIGSANVIRVQVLDSRHLKTESGLTLAHGENLQGKFFDVVIRPEHIELASGFGRNTFRAKVLASYFKGAFFEHLINLEGIELTMLSAQPLPAEPLVRVSKFFIFPPNSDRYDQDPTH
ncbi:MAG: ABC transporter ATP-binding protein [Chloroherpetonaceae bacterium]|nr:ABC transporter ATP-binding protein [Chloroherpetonaceae bacterium]MDW8436971.1 ABC transporter ATP-binding protein [Chloroherpetonaceae bacterium]